MKRRLSPVSLAAATILATGCARPQVLDITGKPTASPINGVWGALARQIDGEGDQRVERHELQVVRRGNNIVGLWTRSVSWTSADGRRFGCTNAPRYAYKLRTILGGPISASAADLRTVRHWHEQEPKKGCPNTPPAPDRCKITRERQTVRLACDGQRPITFHQRLDRPIPLALALARPGSITGVWTWHYRGHDRQGDLKVEDEVWHILQRGDRIEGYYDRQVTVRSRDTRRFVCNNRYAYSNVARFRIVGRVVNRQLQIREVDYTTKPGACETGKRVLDAYRGLLSDDASLVHLSWDRGAQLLYRRY